MSRRIVVIFVMFLLIWTAVLPARAELFGVGASLSAYFLDVRNLNLDGSNEDLLDIEDELPPWLPVPILQGRIHIILPLIFVDTLRLEGGGFGLNLNLNQYLPEMPPDPQVNWELTTSVFSLTFLKQFNLPFIGIYLGLGGDLINGQSRVRIDYGEEDPLDSDISLSWKATTLHGVGGLHLIFGLFRFYLEGKALQPVIQNMDNGLSLLPWQISAGLMLSFG